MNENVDHPAHYGGAESQYEAIKIIDAWNLGFCLGNVVKYVLRAGRKASSQNREYCRIVDLEKALWYLKHEIDRRKEQHGWPKDDRPPDMSTMQSKQP